MTIGDKTIYGECVAIHSRDGERSYFFKTKDGTISLIPADLVDEKEANDE